LNGDVTEEIAKLKKKLKGNIVIHGSAQLVQALVANDLVDELRLIVFPIILGSGKKLLCSITRPPETTLPMGSCRLCKRRLLRKLGSMTTRGSTPAPGLGRGPARCRKLGKIGLRFIFSTL
jgi:riboflavin biosynthesis pyrimidine reductase